MSPTTWTLSARWIFPVDSAPIENGTITIEGQSLRAIESSTTRAADVALGNVAVLPGLVNAHTHLDLSDLRERCRPQPGRDITDWLCQVIRERRSQAPQQVESAIRAGLAESISHGTTLLGDISAGGLSWPILAEAPIRSVVFHELLGLPWPRAEQALASVTSWLTKRPARDNCRPGLSPHAPYSVHAALFQTAAELARRHEIPLATHLAESGAELQLLSDRMGPFVDFLRELGVWDDAGLVRQPDEIVRLCTGAPRLLLIHGNYLPPDVALPKQASVIYCPRTHAAFGHDRHYFEEWLARGINVALGTDSLASNPDLDVLAEARFLRQQRPHLAGETLLRMITHHGAVALGWESETGTLTPGKSADLVVVPLSDERSADPHDLVFGSNEPIRAVLCRGRWIHGQDMPALAPRV